MPDLTIKSVPESIGRSALGEAMKALGFQTENMRRLTIDSETKRADAEIYVLNAEGKKFVDADDEPVTVNLRVQLNI
jgi:hypothetical protein